MLNVVAYQRDARSIKIDVDDKPFLINIHFLNSEKLINIYELKKEGKCYNGWDDAIKKCHSRKAKAALKKAKEILECGI